MKADCVIIFINLWKRTFQNSDKISKIYELLIRPGASGSFWKNQDKEPVK